MFNLMFLLPFAQTEAQAVEAAPTFDGYEHATEFLYDLNAPGPKNSARFLTTPGPRGSEKNLAMVSFDRDNKEVYAILTEATCTGGWSNGCMDGYAVAYAVVPTEIRGGIATSVYSYGSTGWKEAGKVRVTENATAVRAQGYLWSVGAKIPFDLSEDADTSEENHNAAYIDPITAGFLAGLASSAIVAVAVEVYHYCTDEQDADDSEADPDGDGVVNRLDGNDDGDAYDDNADNHPYDPGTH